MMRRLGSTTTTAVASGGNSKRSFVGFVPLDRHFARAVGGHPSFGARAGRSGGGAFAGSSNSSQDPLRSTSSAPLTPEDLFRHVMRNGGGHRPQKTSSSRAAEGSGNTVDPLSSLMGMKAKPSSTSATPKQQPSTSSANTTATAAAESSQSKVANAVTQEGASSAGTKTASTTTSSGGPNVAKETTSKQNTTRMEEQERRHEHPFMTLLETLGEAAPLMIHESLNHSTVEIELPLNVEIKNPKVSLNRPGSASSSSGATPASFLESVLLGKKRGEGNVTVSADITPKLSIEKKVEQKKESDKVKEMLQQYGLPVEHVEVFTDKYGLDSVHVNPVARKFERTFFIDENTYNIEEATPFIEDGMLRLYVPKKKFTQMEKVSKEVVEEAVVEQPKKNDSGKKSSSVIETNEDTTVSSSSPRRSVEESKQESLRSLIPEDLPKPAKVVDSETTSSTSSVAPTPSSSSSSSVLHSENFSTSFAPRAPVNSSTHGTVAWPPRVETNSENPKFTSHTVSIPTAVDADTIALDIVEERGAAEGFAQDSSILKLEVQQKSSVTALNQGETQVFTFYRFFEVPAEVDVDAVTCDFDAETRDLTITVPKPEPKKPEVPRRRIQINRKQ